ncbi:hypothetical protein [Rhizobium sp. L51/94]|uniref:hypothetical protein n=1 Tax=Rhizobium sp. L51/94 TaxID=2819999 RepID=UPI001C5AB47A|nr:hypothetical protein [Rhizobium sp. L51/94]QXZ79636.1 hypothetical protein J5274_06545 [Rhizobium sp. L51/94]
MRRVDPSLSRELMRHFDALPQILRAAISGADFPYDPRWVAKRIERGYRPERVAKLISLATERKIHVG